MKAKKIVTTVFLICLLFQVFSANAETSFPDKMSMEDAVSNTLSQIENSEYKDIEVMTPSGNVSGELVKRSGDVLILKNKTGNIHLQSNKEKVSYILVDIKMIIGVSFYRLE